MRVGQHIRITKNNTYEDFMITEIHATGVLAVSTLDHTTVALKFENGELSAPDEPDTFIYIVPALTGNPNLDVQILAKVDIRGVSMLADLDAALEALSQSTELWYTRVENEFGEAVLQWKPEDVGIQEFYTIYSTIHSRGADAVLLTAANNGSVHQAEIALRAGADPNAYDEESALMKTFWRHNYEVARLLIAHGADVRSGDGDSMLMQASIRGRVDIVKELLAHGADVNTFDLKANTPLILAADNGQLEIVQELLRNAANVDATNEYGMTAVMLAAQKGYLDIVQALLQAHANPNIRNNYGETPLSRTQNPNIRAMLIAAGAT